MIIKRLLDKKKWDDFVQKQLNGNIFQTPEMYDVYKSTDKYEPLFLSVVNKGNEILAILLAIIQKEHTNILGVFSARAIIWGGPLIKDNDPEVLDFLLKEYNKIIKRKTIYTQFRNLWDWKEQKEIFAKNGFDYEDHLDILFDLKKTEDDLWKEMKGKLRTKIRKTYKNNVKIQCLNLHDNKIINDSYKILRDVYLRIKLPFPDKNLFKNAVTYLYDKEYLHAKGAFFENEMIGVRFVLCYKKLIYDWFAGAKDEFLSYRPNDVLPWEIMRWGANNGFEVFDFGGAGKPNVPYGVRDYKLKFGGELVNYGRFQLIHKKAFYQFGIFALLMFKKITKK